MEQLPDSLDETYERILREIRKPNQGHARRMLQCLVAAVRPLRAAELAEILAFDFSGKGIPKLNPDWRLEGHEEAVMSTCSSLVMIVDDKDVGGDEDDERIYLDEDDDDDDDDKGIDVDEDEDEDEDGDEDEDEDEDESENDDEDESNSEVEEEDLSEGDEGKSEDGNKDKTEDSRIVQFAHFSVKEFLMSDRLAESSTGGEATVSQYHIQLEPAHTILAQACLGVLLRLDDRTNRDNIKDFPLAGYAAQHWVDHARFGNVSSVIRGEMECLFDAGRPHFAAWLWIYNEDRGGNPMSTMSPDKPEAAPLYYAARLGFRDLTAHLLAECPDDVRDNCGSEMTPLHATVAHGHLDVFSLLIGHFPSPDIRGIYNQTPLLRVLWREDIRGDLEIGKRLLDLGANVNAHDNDHWTPLYLAAANGRLGFARMLLEHGAEVNTPDDVGRTPLHMASQNGHVEVVLLLLESGADLNLRDRLGRTPSDLASGQGRGKIVELLSGYGAKSIKQ